MSPLPEHVESPPFTSPTLAGDRGHKPAIAYIVQVVAILSALNHLLGGFGALLSPISLGEKAGTLVVSVFIAAISISIFVSLGKKSTFGSKRRISLYLWLMLLIFPITNVMRSVGMYAPMPHFEDNELWGAAFAEMMRYVVFLFLIVWAGVSKGLAFFYTPMRPLVLEPGDR